MQPADDLALAVRAARAAGALAMQHFGTDIARHHKADGSPVSEVDLAVDRLLKRTITSARPDDGWLSEETVDSEDRLECRRVWVVDPIDGTRDFLRGRVGWAVSVALVADGRPVVAALYAPAQETLFTAVSGQGAFANGVPCHVSGRRDLNGVRLPIDAANITAKFWPSPWPGEAVPKPNSLALRMAKLAVDEADAWVEGRSIAEWDVAAAALLLKEAGGTVTDRFGQQLWFNKPSPVVRGIAAATPALHREVLHRLDHAIRALTAHRKRWY
jgi:myo-inositol-1(or 4)-monophosphatase